jgi:hypothetical protein
MALSISAVTPAQVKTYPHIHPVSEILMGRLIPATGKIVAGGEGAITEESADAIPSFKDHLQRTVERVKTLLLKRKSLQRKTGVTPELLEKIDWMNLKHAGLSKTQENRLVELFMLSSIECNPEGIGDCQESDAFGRKFEDKIRLFHQHLPSMLDRYYTHEQVIRTLTPLVRAGIASEENVENLNHHKFDWDI